MKKLSFLISLVIIVTAHQLNGQTLLTGLEEYYNFTSGDQEPIDPINSEFDNTMGSLTGVIGQSSEFLGNRLIRFPAHNNWIIDNNTNLSISFWAEFDGESPGEWANIFGNAPDYSLQFKKLNNGNYVLHWWVSGADPTFTSDFPTPIGWHHYVMSKSASNNLIKFYRDTIEIFSGQPDAIEERGRGKKMFIGGDENVNGIGQEFFNGKIDEMGIWKRALTQDDVIALYNGGLGKAYPFTPNAVTGVSVSPTTTSIVAGTTTTLTQTIAPTNATNQSVTWSSSNTSVATVSSSGVVTGIAAGTATITVATADGGYTATCTVTVTSSSIAVTGVSVSPTTTSIVAGSTTTLTKTIAPTYATNQSVTWSSSNTSVATVNTSGVVTGVEAGTVTITVTTVDGNYTATSTITVTASSGSDFWQQGTGGVYYDGDNVGIGTSTPAAKLDMLTDHTSQIPIRITHNNYNDWVLMKRRTDDSQRFGIKEENGEGSMGLATAGLTRMTIDQFGYVGIGLTDPGSYDSWSRNLVVGNTTTNTGITILSNSVSTGSLIFADGTGDPADQIGRISYNHASNIMQFYTNNTNVATLKERRLGIGTDNPMAGLHLYNTGGIIIQDQYMTQRFALNASDGGVTFSLPLNRNGIQVPAYFHWANQGTEAAILTLHNNGTVLIGNNVSENNTKLIVKGGIKATRIDITLTVPASDHVFNSDYKLMSLVDLNKFIKANKHLPEVPSAKEFQENGYSVGDMDNLLLKKVEELTLYILEQQKKIDQLQSEINQLKK